MFPLIPWYFR